MTEKNPGGQDDDDAVDLGAKIAKEFSSDSSETAANGSPLLVIAFSAPAATTADTALAEADFSAIYRRIVRSHQGQVSVTKVALSTHELGAALERGRANHSKYVVSGTVDEVDHEPLLKVTIARVADGAVVWSKSYAAGTDPATIADDVASNLPPLE